MEYLAMTKTREGKRNVKTKAPEQKCLRCEKAAIAGKRGLCSHHYNQFDWDRECAAQHLKGKKAVDAMRDFDKAEVEAGRVLCARRGRRRTA